MSVPAKRSGESKSEYRRRLQQSGFNSDVVESAVDAAADLYTSSSSNHSSYHHTSSSDSSSSSDGGGGGGSD